jgi:ABC-type multidrug transport system ATPase subunit
VQFFARLAGLKGQEANSSTKHVLRLLQCTGYDDRFPRELSFGMYQKVRLARVLVMNPDILLLDEPSTGVDIVGVAELSRLIRQISGLGIPIFLATHSVRELEDFCSRLTVMKHGKSVFSGATEELLNLYSSKSTEDALYTIMEGNNE